MMDDILQRAVRSMEDGGAEFCDVRSQSNHSLSIRIVDRKVRELKDHDLSGVGIRARVGGSWGYTSTTSASEREILREAAKAVKSAKAGNGVGAPIAGTKAVRKKVVPNLKVRPQDISLEEKLSILMDLDEAQRISDKIVNTNSAFREEIKSNLLMNSFGSRVEWEVVRYHLAAVSVAAESGRMERYVEIIGGTGDMKRVKEADVNEMGAKCAKEAIRTLAAVRPPSGLMTCVSDPQISGLLAHEVMGHASEADEIVKKRSFLTGKVGEAVASEDITMIDDGTVPGAFGSTPFDDEGFPTQRTMIIEDGVYKGYMHNMETAAAMGVASTGNGRAQDFGRKVFVRMTNTFFDGGDWTLEEMIEDIDHGVLTDRGISGMEDPVGGGFEAKALRGHLIEHGKITKMTRGITVTGKALEILKATDAVGKAIRLDPGFCGKGIEDFVPVTSGGPYCRSKLIVGGD